jgi:hypothetical protein
MKESACDIYQFQITGEGLYFRFLTLYFGNESQFHKKLAAV